MILFLKNVWNIAYFQDYCDNKNFESCQVKEYKMQFYFIGTKKLMAGIYYCSTRS